MTTLNRHQMHIFRAEGASASRYNEVLYLPAGDEQAVWGNVVLFPGDLQDLHHRMLSAGHGEFAEYCLETTAQVLAGRFPGHAVWVVLPKTHVNGVLASYDNFVKADWAAGGAVSEYLPEGSACRHLEALLDAAADAAQSLQQNCAYGRPDMSLPLTLVGFSKGAVVLNQLVTELGRETEPEAASPRTPSGSSKRRGSCDDLGPVPFANNCKRSRVSINRSDCGGGERSISSSEGILTSPSSPADDRSVASGEWSRSMSWDGEGEQDTERPGGGEVWMDRSRTTGQRNSNRSNQSRIGSMWYRLCSTLSMLRSSARPSFSASPVSSESESQALRELDRGAGVVAGRNGSETYQGPGDLIDLGSPSTRSGSARKRLRRRMRTCASSPSSCLSSGEGSSSSAGRERTKSSDCPAQRLFDRVAAIHWVDGGNGGEAGSSFPTNTCSLARLASNPNLAVRVHGTPYQWGQCGLGMVVERPFLAFEAEAFLATIEGFRQAVRAREGQGSDCATTKSTRAGMGRVKPAGRFGAACDVKRFFYFEDEQPSLENHFRVLKELSVS